VNIHAQISGVSESKPFFRSSADKVPALAIVVNIVMKETNSPPPPSLKVPGPFSLSNENMLKILLSNQDSEVLVLKESM
jgi:hypothetical protein